MWNQWKFFEKIVKDMDFYYILTYVGLKWGQKRPENFAHGGDFSHTMCL